MTTVAELLARKQQLIERLEQGPEPNERVELERLLEQVNIALGDVEDQQAGRN